MRHLGAVQSQDYPGAKWSLAMRLKRATDASLDAAFDAGRFLRTHVLRPTWHFVLPEDIRWMLELTSPHVRRQMGYYNRHFELSPAVYRKTHRILEKALRDQRHLTRTEVAAELARGGVRAAGTRLAFILIEAEQIALVCSGAMKGKQQSYALLTERAPEAKALPRDEARARLALRFFQGHSPATLRHFAWWSQLTLAEAKRGLADVDSQLEREVRDGTEWYSAAGRTAQVRSVMAHLIPEYDEALVGSADMEHKDIRRTASRRADNFIKPIVIGGRHAGAWRRLMGPRTVTIEAALQARLSASESTALRRAVERYAEFLGRPVMLRTKKG